VKKFDYLIVGAGFFGAVFARQAKDKGKNVLVVDRRKHIGGNCYTENISGINVHKYGAHIFHTSSRDVWEFINRFAEFNRYTHQITANYCGEFYNLPFNMNTFYQLWKVKTPTEAINKIKEQKFNGDPKNLEEQALSLVGKDIYEKLIKGYTEKQWGKKATELPASIIKRIPLRFNFDNCYYNDSYQGIPLSGYTTLFENMLKGIEIRLNVDYLKNRAEFDLLADKVIFTGSIDEFFDYSLGTLEYRSLRFETETLKCENFQGCAVMNYTDSKTAFTRIIEHKHFEQAKSAETAITREYPADWKIGYEAYYPINDPKNDDLYKKYSDIGKTQSNIIFGGRLGMYKYYDMDDVIEFSLKLAERKLG
jgi:UDP-galactopyranose mutase